MALGITRAILGAGARTGGCWAAIIRLQDALGCDTSTNSPGTHASQQYVSPGVQGERRLRPWTDRHTFSTADLLNRVDGPFVRQSDGLEQMIIESGRAVAQEIIAKRPLVLEGPVPITSLRGMAEISVGSLRGVQDRQIA